MAIVPDEGNDLFAKVGIEDGLDVTAVEWVRAFVVKAEAVDGIDAEDFDFATFDEIGEGADHALAFEFGFVAGAGGKAENGLAPVAVDDHAEVEPQAGKCQRWYSRFISAPCRKAGRVCQPRRGGGNAIEAENIGWGGVSLSDD